MRDFISKARIIISALILCPVLLYWGFSESPIEQFPSKTQHSEHVDYFIEKAQIQEWDSKGRLERKIETIKLEHKPAFSANYLQTPISTQFQKNGAVSELTSRSAVAQDDNSRTDFMGDVIIVSNKQQSNQTTLTTEKLSVFPQLDIAETDQPVTIETANTRMQGTGMDINFNDQVLNLHSRVKGTHNNAK